MRSLLIGAGMVLVFLGKVALKLGHVAFSSVYQNAMVVSKQLQDELRQLREQGDDLDF